METSKSDTVEVSAATVSNRKKSVDHRADTGIWLKTLGSVTNTRSGPATGSSPQENTAGKMMMPESMATEVSSMATVVAVLIRWVLAVK